jgi:hypothetical protein
MSALPLKADIETQPRDVRFVPKADIFGRLYSIIRCQPPQRSQSKKFRISVEKLPDSRRGIGAMASRISDMGIKPGAIMTIAEYLAATVDRLDCVGRVGAANARKLSGANEPCTERWLS